MTLCPLLFTNNKIRIARPNILFVSYLLFYSSKSYVCAPCAIFAPHKIFVPRVRWGPHVPLPTCPPASTPTGQAQLL